jgi:hypothetical protein
VAPAKGARCDGSRREREGALEVLTTTSKGGGATRFRWVTMMNGGGV